MQEHELEFLARPLFLFTASPAPLGFLIQEE